DVPRRRVRVVGLEDQRRLVAPGVQVPVQAVHAGIELTVLVPADAEVLRIEAGVLDARWRRDPVKPLSGFAPEPFRILQRRAVAALVLLAGRTGLRLEAGGGGIGGRIHRASWVCQRQRRRRDASVPQAGLHPAFPASGANFGHVPPFMVRMETDFLPFEWQRLLLGETPLGYYFEIAFKCVVVFLILLLVLRLLGKRGQQNLSPMQQMLMIALGSAAGDALLYPGVSIGHAGLILVGVTVLTVGMENIAERSRPVRDYLESRPRVLVRDGVVDED